jgi:hypothetical protein
MRSMDQRVNVYLQVKTRYYRESLAALLASVPGVRILSGSNDLVQPADHHSRITPEILLFEGNLVNLEQAAHLRKIRSVCPQMKIILLISSITPNSPASQQQDVDLVLPVNATARELIQSVNHLAGLN